MSICTSSMFIWILVNVIFVMLFLLFMLKFCTGIRSMFLIEYCITLFYFLIRLLIKKTLTLGICSVLIKINDFKNRHPEFWFCIQNIHIFIHSKDEQNKAIIDRENGMVVLNYILAPAHDVARFIYYQTSGITRCLIVIKFCFDCIYAKRYFGNYSSLYLFLLYEYMNIILVSLYK